MSEGALAAASASGAPNSILRVPGSGSSERVRPASPARLQDVPTPDSGRDEPMRASGATSSYAHGRSTSFPSQEVAGEFGVETEYGPIVSKSFLTHVSSMMDGVLSLEFGELVSRQQGSVDVAAMRAGAGLHTPLDPTEEEAEKPDQGFGESVTPVSQAVKSAKVDLASSGMQRQTRAAILLVVENRCFIGVFMSLTFYVLFAPDIDLLYGSKDSEKEVSIATSVVLCMFVVEMILQSLAKPTYFPRWPFFLDFIAAVSIIPDTYWFKMAITGSDTSLVSARPSDFESFFKHASRSTRAFRLNRLFRIVRVVALVPRVTGLFFRNKNNEEQVEKMLKKKLEKVFAVLDDDLDGRIDEEALALCLDKLQEGKRGKTSGRSCAETKSSVSMISAGGMTARSGASRAASSAGGLSPASHAATLTTLSTAAAGEPSPAQHQLSGDGSPSAAQRSLRLPDNILAEIEREVATTTAGRRAGAVEGQVTFELFYKIILQDEWVTSRLRRACQEQVKKSNNLGNMASKHAEDVGMKVALAVLLMLLVVNTIAPSPTDDSALQGLKYLDHQVASGMANGMFNTSGPISMDVREHAEIWLQGGGSADSIDSQEVYYLDLNHYVYCNMFLQDGQTCRDDGGQKFWSPRGSLAEIDADWVIHGVRREYVEVLLEPDNTDRDDLTAEEYNARTRSVAVIYVGGIVKANARQLIFTTLVVITIIILGIIFITKDLTYLHRNLTRPLRTLALEMQSIKQLQLAGMGEQRVEDSRSTTEIRRIQKIFDNMKTAIKSWGKYVPWPVVQLLLQAGVDAKQGCEEKEVTLYFSDIAGFTSIVEHMPPERSMQLLSRYFNDMSKVIDDNGGIVIEFIGDAILAMYGAPLRDLDHPTNAVQASMQMLAALDRINKWSVSQNPPFPEVSIRCGIHTGRCLVGNMGFQSRIKYGVIGENANIPARLEEMNKNYGTNNLMSEDTLDKLDKSRLNIRPIDYVRIRSSEPPLTELVYEVLGVGQHRRVRKSALKAVALKHTQAMKCYIEQRFEEAMPLFAEVNETMKQLTNCEADRPSVIMHDRCKAYLVQKPKPDWDGRWQSEGAG